MKVKLLGVTQPVDKEIVKNGIDDVQELIAYCARVSNPANQFNTLTSEKLIGYLIKHKHWSPLEMASATIEIDTTRDIARQVLRHRSFSFQEFSQRYANPQDMEESFVLREARFQDPVNRQNSIELDINDRKQMVIAQEWLDRQQVVIDTAVEQYNWAIENGIAKEQARAVLPEGNTKSRLMMAGTIRSWIHYIELRAGNGTQKEHIEIAKACAQAIVATFPLASQLGA